MTREPAKDPIDLGQVAYEAYCDYVGWKSVRGEDLPGFSRQEPRLQNAWRLAAGAATAHLALLRAPHPGGGAHVCSCGRPVQL